MKSYGSLIGAVDQGTSSTRFLVFAVENCQLITFHQIPVKTVNRKPGWSEQDPLELLNTVIECINVTCSNLQKLDIDPADIAAIGITNQRETTIVWDKETGLPLYPAILWNDTRTEAVLQDILDTTPRQSTHAQQPAHMEQWHKPEHSNAATSEHPTHSTNVQPPAGESKYPHPVLHPNIFELQQLCGLPLSTYFSALKLVWLFDNVPEVRSCLDRDKLLFGTVDSWLIWNLTGGTKGGVHVTDVTNASRTMLMNLGTLDWDPFLLRFFSIPPSILPRIKSSSEVYGDLKTTQLAGVPIAGCLGDQQAALLGQQCVHTGQTKATYGTGCFVLTNIGTLPIITPGLITTVAYKLGDEPAYFAIEGSISEAGSALSLLSSWGLDSTLVASSTSSDGVQTLPCFSGLLAPRWRPEARGVISGISAFTMPQHIIYSILEAISFQVQELIEMIENSIGIRIPELLVDGGLSHCDNLLKVQADVLGVDVIRPGMLETTALGAATAAGLCMGVWGRPNLSQTPVNLPLDRFKPRISQDERTKRCNEWRQFVDSALSREQERCSEDGSGSVSSSLPGTLFLFSSFLLWFLSNHLPATDG